MKLRILAACIGAAAATAQAQVLLNDGNSSATIDPTSAQPTFLRGMNSWTVDGVNQLFNQWYWFRIGNGAERTIDTISAPTVTQPAANIANIRYANQLVAIDITFTLIGGSAGSGASDISEVVRVRNLGATALDFHLFEYDDFDVNGSFTDDSAERLDPSSIRQFDGLGSATVGSVQAADRWQIALVPTVFDLLDDGVASNLANSGSPTGPGDVAFALQWDRTIAPNDTFLMSKNKLIDVVPEPASALSLGLGWLFVRRVKRRRNP